MKGACEREGERKFRNERWNAWGKGKRDMGERKWQGRGESRENKILRNLLSVRNGR